MNNLEEIEYNNDYKILKNQIQKFIDIPENKKYKLLIKKELEQKEKKINHPKEKRGGHNKDIIMLTINSFKKFCLKADEIHDYFIKLENIFHEIIIEESDELKQQLLNLEDIKKQEYETKLEKQKILEREKILLNEYATIGAIFYIIKVKTFDNGQYIIKIGESLRGIQDRYKEHKSKYEECLLLDCFTVNKSMDFETFIKEHEHIRCNKVNDLLGHESELELFLIGKNLSYNTLLNIINNNLKYFNNNDTNKLELEIEQLKLLLEVKNTNNDNLIIQELVKTVKQLSSKMDNLENINKDILVKFNSMQSKTTTNFDQPLITLGHYYENPSAKLWDGVYKNNYKKVEEAFKEGADVNMKNDNGVWFLLVASGHGNARMVNLLLEKGIDVNITDDYDYNNNTALSTAVINAKYDVVELLLEKGADINKENNKGDTPLIHAIRFEDYDMVQLLLEHPYINIELDVDTNKELRLARLARLAEELTPEDEEQNGIPYLIENYIENYIEMKNQIKKQNAI